MRALVTGICGLALVTVVAAGCTESGNDTIGAGQGERAPSASPPAATSPSPSTSPATGTAPYGSGSATSPTPGTTGDTTKSDAGASSSSDTSTSSTSSSSPAASAPTSPSERDTADTTRTDQAAAGRGQGSEQASAIQEALKEKGHDPGPIDGIVGPKTQAALREFQQAEGLEPTGRTDEETLTALGIEQK